MNAQVSIRFGPNLTIEIDVPLQRPTRQLKHGARRMAGTRLTTSLAASQLDRLARCSYWTGSLVSQTPPGRHTVQRDAEWRKLYAQAVSSALDRTGVQVNVEERTVSS